MWNRLGMTSAIVWGVILVVAGVNGYGEEVEETDKYRVRGSPMDMFCFPVAMLPSFQKVFFGTPPPEKDETLNDIK